MRTILAALDSSPAARPVIETALGLGERLDAAVAAVHVTDGPTNGAERAAAAEGVPLRRLSGGVVERLLDVLDAPDVVLGVLGARGFPSGRRPVGSAVLRVLQQTRKPIVVVPPEAFGVCPRPFRRLLVPLDGTERAAVDAVGVVDALSGPDSELVVVHVFDDRARPPILNHGYQEFEPWGREFLARHLPDRDARFEWRSGHAASLVAEMCDEPGVDLVVLSWSQVFEGHADVIRAVLSRSRVPVLVVPAASSIQHVPAEVRDLDLADAARSANLPNRATRSTR
jgi:nucleotide-binding universal stress UspA family protein